MNTMNAVIKTCFPLALGLAIGNFMFQFFSQHPDYLTAIEISFYEALAYIALIFALWIRP